MNISYQPKRVASILSAVKRIPKAPMMISILIIINLPGLTCAGSRLEGASSFSESNRRDQGLEAWDLGKCLFAKIESFIIHD